jgi:hypothetical protein
VPVTLPLHDRSFDLVLLSNWEDEIVYQSNQTAAPSTVENNNLTTPVNKALESGAWTQSIIWSTNAPFRDFTQLELNEEDIVEEHPQGSLQILFIDTSTFTEKKLQRPSGQKSDFELMMLNLVTNSTCPTIIFTRCRKKVAVTVCAKLSDNLWSSMPILLRSSSFPLCAKMILASTGLIV